MELPYPDRPGNRRQLAAGNAMIFKPSEVTPTALNGGNLQRSGPTGRCLTSCQDRGNRPVSDRASSPKSPSPAASPAAKSDGQLGRFMLKRSPWAGRQIAADDYRHDATRPRRRYCHDGQLLQLRSGLHQRQVFVGETKAEFEHRSSSGWPASDPPAICLPTTPTSARWSASPSRQRVLRYIERQTRRRACAAARRGRRFR